VATSRPAPDAHHSPTDDADPIRVLWLVKGFGPGGAERLLTLMARGRDRSRFQVRAAYLLPHKVALVPELEAEGVPVSCVGRSRLIDPRWLVTLRRSLVEEPVDVVHAHSPVAAVGARLVVRSLPRRRRPRMVTTDHSLWDGHVRSTRWVDAASWRLDDAHVAVSEAVHASLPPGLRSRAEVVLHGIDARQVQADGGDRAAVRAELGLDADALVVGTVANMRPVKGYPDLLEAARQVLAKLPDVRFVTIGQGPQEAEVRALHARIGLGNGVQLLGHRRDAVRVMGACDVFCLASHHEGLPVALMEALALGLPVVATGVGGITEVVTDGCEGLLVDPGRPGDLAAALIDVLTDGERREAMAARARQRGQALSVEPAVRRNEAIYEALRASSRRA
jgi:glycosyltransferase involved in cell wall biosynthesis